jgi:hypothetical protein
MVATVASLRSQGDSYPWRRQADESGGGDVTVEVAFAPLDAPAVGHRGALGARIE